MDETSYLRPGAAALSAGPWPLETPLNEDGLGLDSLERMSVAAALSQTLHLHESSADELLTAHATFGDWLRITGQALAQVDARLTFRTSGSSGQPKPCTHTLADLQQETRFLARLFTGAHRKPLRRVLTAVPAHHIYGFLFTVLLPVELGHLPVQDVRRVTVNDLPRRMAAGDLLVSHPAHWALLARHASALPAGVIGTTSTAPCPDETAQALTRCGLQRLVQVYGSSETAGIAWRDAPAAHYELMAHWTRPDNQAHDLLRHSDAGDTRAFALQDALKWHGPRHFNVMGRLDQAVQVGGINVFPSRVRDVLLQHPEVADAAVRLMALQDSARLKAFVVPRPEADITDLTQRLDTWLAPRLSAAERPRAFALGSELPRNAQGKLADWV
ncbi:4-coumarate-CoA ligase [Sphaerotilus natans subsp. natans DSM 6575]|uniref:4-coumarate-CoA ligase n=1 Tax=Sphaerotilus natans subsp. natans DSM 6575 TaxID=1286631 RepID=A0A059KH59_9BURK|nr:4-coumarate-CoA ligase [Sphaerotilus natans subsp. natans DSM 6575]